MNTPPNMATTTEVIQIDRALVLEKELQTERKRVAAALRRRREELGLSLREVSPKVRLSAASLSYIERGEQWHAPTIRRLARFYETAA